MCQLNGVEELDSSTDLRNLDYLMELSNGIIWTCVEVESFYKDVGYLSRSGPRSFDTDIGF